MSIKKLSKEVIDLIAAGEVVERPSSVVKELVENAIDAKATSIIVRVEDHGRKLISVEDNGTGIDSDDILMLFEQHATSKINNKEDIEGISTLGFRGEAIASISSVASKVIVNTRSQSHNGIEAIRENTDTRTNSRSFKQGTKIDISGLFDRIPARKKFLKSENTELKHIIDTFLNTALPFINIHFELYHDDKLIYRLTKVKEHKERIFEIWGKKIATNLFSNSAEISDNFKIEGLIGNSFIGKAKNKLQFVFINNRYVINRTIVGAVTQAFKGFIHTDLQPTFFLFLNIDPKTFDINVHPRKLEVKFEDDKKIFSLVYNFVKKTLEKTTKSNFDVILNQQPDRNEQSTNEYKIAENRVDMFSDNTVSYKSPNVRSAMSFTQSLLSPTRETYVHTSETVFNESLANVGFSPKQVFNTYIVYENDTDLIFIDQHAAAEKISFEKILRDLGKLKTRPLLIPTTYDFKNESDKQEILSNSDDLNKIGFVIEDFGPRSIQLLEIPEFMDEVEFDEIIEDLLINDSKELGIKVDENLKISEKTYLSIATVACHGSIRAGQKLSDSEMSKIINGLRSLNNPGHCPHGRPTIWKINKYEIEKHFNRNI